MQRFFRNVASNYCVAGVNGLLFLVVTPLIVHYLGLAHYAVWVILQTIGYYLGFLDLGLVEAQIRQHARLKANRDYDALNGLLGTVATLYLTAGAVGVLVALALTATPIESWLDVAPDLAAVFPAALVTIGAYNLFTLLDRGINAVYEAEERFDAVNLIQMAVQVCRALAVCVVLLAGYGLTALLVLQVAFAAIACAAKLIWLPRVAPHLSYPKPQFDRAAWDGVKGYSLWNSLNDFMTEGTAHFDKLLIPVFLGSALVGPYSLVVTVAAAVFVVAEPITNTFLPMFSRVGESGSREPTRILLSRGTRLVLLFTAPVAFVIGVYGNALLDLWIGPEYTPVSQTVLWLTVGNFFFSTVLWTALNLLMAAGHIRSIFRISVTEVLLALALIVGLTPVYGLAGLALAGLIANVVIGLACFIPMACREAGESTAAYLSTTLGPALLATVPAGLVAILLAPHIDLERWVDTLGAACLCGAVCFFTIGILAIPRRERFRYLITFRQFLRPA